MAVNDGVVIYDIEIINPIRPKELKGTWLNSLNQWKAENPGKEIVFSDSWTDFQSMGIACIGAYDYQTDLFRVFLKDNMIDFITLINSRKWLVGYNNTNFDDKILFAYDIPHPKTWDLLRAIWTARGDDPDRPRFKGTGLNDVSMANNLPGKYGDGMQAALNWQMGNFGQTIDYCLRDVWLTKKLIDICVNEGNIVDAEGNILDITPPWLEYDELPF